MNSPVLGRLRMVINRQVLSSAEMIESLHRWGVLRCVNYRHGWIVRVGLEMWEVQHPSACTARVVFTSD
jgi:hypothetical protein